MGYTNLRPNSDSFFARSASDRLRSYLDSSWSASVFGDDTFVDFYGIDPLYVHNCFNPGYPIILIFTSPTPVEHVDAFTPEELPNSCLEPSTPSLDASSLQIRFACHHPQCGGRTFSRRSERDRHARVHDVVRQYVCPRANCVKKFYRKDKLQSHLKKGH
jgi:Zinc finger, C2H2 type